MTDEIFQDAEARDSAQEREAARHELTVKVASALFAEFGVPRSPRSVQGFCKDGHIDCVRVKGPNGDRYFVNRQSVERYATELKQIEEVGKISSDCRATIKVRTPDNQDEKVVAGLVPQGGRSPTVGASPATTGGETLLGEPIVI